MTNRDEYWYEKCYEAINLLKETTDALDRLHKKPVIFNHLALIERSREFLGEYIYDERITSGIWPPG